MTCELRGRPRLLKNRLAQIERQHEKVRLHQAQQAAQGKSRKNHACLRGPTEPLGIVERFPGCFSDEQGLGIWRPTKST